jgi:ribosome-binding factor A
MRFLGKGPSQRQLRVGELIRAALSELFIHKDGFEAVLTRQSLTVTEVRVSPDLKQAVAFVIPLGGGSLKDEEEVMAALARARKNLRTEVAARVKLRFAPDIDFAFDHSFDRAAEVDTLLRQAQVARDLAGAEPGEGDRRKPRRNRGGDGA